MFGIGTNDWAALGQAGDLLQGIGSLVTIIALCIAGFWFRYQKTHRARIADSAVASIVGVNDDGSTVLEVTITLENNGAVPFWIDNAEARVFDFNIGDVNNGCSDKIKIDESADPKFDILPAPFTIPQNSKMTMQFFYVFRSEREYALISWFITVNKERDSRFRNIYIKVSRKFLRSSASKNLGFVKLSKKLRRKDKGLIIGNKTRQTVNSTKKTLCGDSIIFKVH